MNKSVALLNLDLPTDLIHSICEFIFFSKEQFIKKKREMHIKINNIITLESYITIQEYYTYFKNVVSISYSKVQMQYIMCKRCGNYKLSGFRKLNKNCIKNIIMILKNNKIN
jgi:hypothetical protein